jgi:hypothetical protein
LAVARHHPDTRGALKAIRRSGMQIPRLMPTVSV